MTGQGGYVRNWVGDAVRGWDRFWFTPADSATLSLIRVLAGAMLFYTHLVWSLGLDAFFGPHGWLTPTAIATLPDRQFQWSYFYWIDSPSLLWTVHIAALVVFAMLTLGIFTRVTSILAYLAAVSYANRVAPAATFGLDDTNVMLAMYLMIGASGAYYSFDSWWAKRRGRAGGAETQHLAPLGKGQVSAGDSPWRGAGPSPSVATNIAIRLLQLHLCIVYLFSGMGKLLGGAWWDGTATWRAIANLEYQSLDVTWLAKYPYLMDAMTHAALLWEVFFIALVWPRWTRPIALFMAVMVHGGIALFLGMKTFGLAMLIANLAFVSPEFVRSILHRDRQPVGDDVEPLARKAKGQGRGVVAKG